MNPETGEIKNLEDFSRDEPKMPIPESELSKVKKMNRKARRAWAAQQQRAARRKLKTEENVCGN